MVGNVTTHGLSHWVLLDVGIWEITVKLDDGSMHTIQIGLK
jgi:hypothetical protein